MPRPDSTEPAEPKRMPQRIGGVEMWVLVTRVAGAVFGPFPSREAAMAWAERETTEAERYGTGWARPAILLDPDEPG